MKHSYSNLKIKLIIRVLLTFTLAAFAYLAILTLLWDGQEFILRLFTAFAEFLGIDENTAFNIFQNVFRDNKEILLIGFFGLITIGLFYFTLSKVTSYLNEVSKGVEEAIKDNAEPIHLSKELRPMEDKLNEIKMTLRENKEAAKEADKRKNDLVVYLAHDLKTPLTSVIGYLNLLNDEQGISHELRQKYLGISLNKAERLEDLINEFFDITRFNLQEIILEVSPINISLMINQLADEMYPVFASKGLRYELEIEKDLVVEGDAEKLARVLDNLIGNAVNYSYDNSIIKIKAYRKEHQIIVAIQNKGPVIPAQKLESIFESFYRLDTSRSSKTGGAGLGLAIAKEIILHHNGTIEVASNKAYTEFTICLPGESKE